MPKVYLVHRRRLPILGAGAERGGGPRAPPFPSQGRVKLTTGGGGTNINFVRLICIICDPFQWAIIYSNITVFLGGEQIFSFSVGQKPHFALYSMLIS